MSAARAPIPLLFLISDTGGGHRSAAGAVSQALDLAFPGRYAPVICDPLRGPAAPRRLRWLIGLYGPTIRLTPWLWGLLWRATSAPRPLRLCRRTLLAPAYASVAAAVADARPAAIVAFHPFTAHPAVAVRDAAAPGIPVITVITDLVSAHLSWRDAAADRVVVPSAAVWQRCGPGAPGGDRRVNLGLPVAAEFCAAPAQAAERAALRRSLGLAGHRFLVVMTGGAEGSGQLYRRAAAMLRNTQDVNLAVICGHNRWLRRRLERLAARSAGRLSVHGFVGNMADWLRCADVVVGKAGPGTIAEAACCAAPLVLTSSLPGQEMGNAAFVTQAGAGRYVPRPRDLAAEISRLSREPATLAAMRTASAALSRPAAAADIAALLARATRSGDVAPKPARSPHRPARTPRAGTSAAELGPPGATATR